MRPVANEGTGDPASTSTGTPSGPVLLGALRNGLTLYSLGGEAGRRDMTSYETSQVVALEYA
jgi:hypothetical protein